MGGHRFDRLPRPFRRRLTEGPGTAPPGYLRLRGGSCGRRAGGLGSGDASRLVPALCAARAGGYRRHSSTGRAGADRVGSRRRICAAGVRSSAQQAREPHPRGASTARWLDPRTVRRPSVHSSVAVRRDRRTQARREAGKPRRQRHRAARPASPEESSQHRSHRDRAGRCVRRSMPSATGTRRSLSGDPAGSSAPSGPN